MNGVLFGDKHSYDDFGLILISKTVAPPEPKLYEVELPGTDGIVDLSECLTGDVKYENRKIKFEFSVVENRGTWPDLYSKISNYLHGQRMKIILDVDKSFYYEGRLQVSQWEDKRGTATIIIEGSVDPYKYDVSSSLQQWEWDPFSF